MHGLGKTRIKRVGVNFIEVLDRVMISLKISRIKVDRIITFIQKVFTECPVCVSRGGSGRGAGWTGPIAAERTSWRSSLRQVCASLSQGSVLPRSALHCHLDVPLSPRTSEFILTALRVFPPFLCTDGLELRIILVSFPPIRLSNITGSFFARFLPPVSHSSLGGILSTVSILQICSIGINFGLAFWTY